MVAITCPCLHISCLCWSKMPFGNIHMLSSYVIWLTLPLCCGYPSLRNIPSGPDPSLIEVGWMAPWSCLFAKHFSTIFIYSCKLACLLVQNYSEELQNSEVVTLADYCFKTWRRTWAIVFMWMFKKCFPVEKSTFILAIGFISQSWWNLPIRLTTTSVSTAQTEHNGDPYSEASFIWKTILVSASSWLQLGIEP